MKRIIRVWHDLKELILFLRFLYAKFRLEFEQWKLKRAYEVMQKNIGLALMPAMKDWIKSVEDVLK